MKTGDCFRLGIFDMRTAEIVFACLAIALLPHQATAQQSNPTKAKIADISIVAYVGTIKYAVMKAPPSPLGYFYSISGETRIKFHPCGKPDAPQDLGADDVVETTEDCKSLPGTPRTPLLDSISSWMLQDNGEFIVSAIDAAGSPHKQVVKCEDVPTAYVLAAKKQSEQNKGVVIGKEVDAADVKSLFGVDMASIFKAASAPKNCSSIPSFWTVPLDDVTTPTGIKQVVGLSVADPTNASEIETLERQLKSN